MIILEDTDLHSFKFDKLKVINVNIKGIIKENMEDKQKTDNVKVENDKENIQDKQNPDPMKYPSLPNSGIITSTGTYSYNLAKDLIWFLYYINRGTNKEF